MSASLAWGGALTEVRLYGALGARFGRVHRLAVSSVREACQALAAVVPGFERYLVEHSAPGYHVFIGKPGQNNRGADELDAPVSRREAICIVPVVSGRKRQGTFQTILGVILIVVAAYFTGGASLTVGGASAGIWGTVSAIGVSMAIGGVVQLLSPQSRTNAAAAESGSRSFSEAASTSPQGLPVPLTFGRCFVQGVVVSAGLLTDVIPGSSGGSPSDPSLPAGQPQYPFTDSDFQSPGNDGANGNGTGESNGGGDGDGSVGSAGTGEGGHGPGESGTA